MNKPLTARQQAFLDAYRFSGMVKEAAAQIGCSRELHYGALRTSETYRDAFALVQQDVAYELEEEARRRALQGVKIPILFRGKVVGYETRYSDTLLVFLLEANNPEKFAGIRKELSRSEDGFRVRWDREEFGRPRLPRMIGPQPPKPPRPPRPPRPPLRALDGDRALEWPPGDEPPVHSEPDPDLIKRWAAMDFAPEESALRNAPAPEPESDGGDAEVAPDLPPDLPFDLPFEADCGGSDDNDVGFCVRCEDDEHDGSTTQVSEPVPVEATRLRGLCRETGWPEERFERSATTDRDNGCRRRGRGSSRRPRGGERHGPLSLRSRPNRFRPGTSQLLCPSFRDRRRSRDESRLAPQPPRCGLGGPVCRGPPDPDWRCIADASGRPIKRSGRAIQSRF